MTNSEKQVRAFCDMELPKSLKSRPLEAIEYARERMKTLLKDESIANNKELVSKLEDKMTSIIEQVGEIK